MVVGAYPCPKRYAFHSAVRSFVTDLPPNQLTNAQTSWRYFSIVAGLFSSTNRCCLYNVRFSEEIGSCVSGAIIIPPIRPSLTYYYNVDAEVFFKRIPCCMWVYSTSVSAQHGMGGYYLDPTSMFSTVAISVYFGVQKPRAVLCCTGLLVNRCFVLPNRYTGEAIPSSFRHRTISATAWAAIPSPAPVKPSFSSVVAFTLT